MVAVAVAASASASAAAAVAAYVTFSHLSHTNSFLCHTQTHASNSTLIRTHTQRTHSITNSVVDARETNKKNGKAKTVTKFHTSKVFFMNMRVALPANNCSQVVVVVVTVVDIALTVVVVGRVVAVTVADQWSM